MLTLSLQPKTVDVPLTDNVVVHVRTATSVDVIAAEQQATLMMKAAMEGRALTELIGFGMTSTGPNLEDPAIRAAWTSFVTEVLLAEQVISGWEGIGNGDGEPIEPDRASIAALMQDPRHRTKLRSAIEAPLVALEGEAKK
jgi:hypothetical protein